MKLDVKFLAVIIFIFFATSKGNAQPVISPPGNLAQNQVFLSVGLEPELVTSFGYMHVIGSPGKQVDFHVGASVKLAPLIISNGAWQANLIGAADWRMSNHWGTRFTTNLYNAHDLNRAGVMDGLGFMLRATPVHYGKKWISGFNIGWQYTALTHITHSAAAKDTFKDRYALGEKGIEGPRDGWYRAAVSRFRLGFVGSRKLNDHLRLQLRIGSLVFIQKQGVLLGFSYAQVPIYVNSQLTYGW